MDAVDTEDFASLDDINPTLHEMADPPVLTHTFPDAAKSIPDSLDEITQSLKLLDKKNDEARHVYLINLQVILKFKNVT